MKSSVYVVCKDKILILTVIFFVLPSLQLLLPLPSASARTSLAPVVFLLRDRGTLFAAPAMEYASGTRAKYLSAGDLDGDGWVDFAVPSDGTQIYIHFNNRDATLTDGSAIGVSAASEHTLIVDVNGDGRNDILVSHPGSDTSAFSVLLQDDSIDGAFPVAVEYLDSGIGRNMVAGDVDGDYDIDIVIAVGDMDTGKLAVMLNNGDGTFTEAAGRLASHTVTGLDIADIDGDGMLDLLSTLIHLDEVRINMGRDSDPYFGDARSIDVHQGPYQGQFANVNGDDRVDIVVGGLGIVDDFTSDNVTFVPGTNAGNITGMGDSYFDQTARVATQTGQYKSRGFLAADFNGDGRIDIAASSVGMNESPPPPGGSIRLLFGDGFGRFGRQQFYENYPGARGMVAVDYDRDGTPGHPDLDLIFAIGDKNAIGIMTNTSIR